MSNGLEALERYHNGDVLVSKADSRYEDEYLILEDNEEYQTIKRELNALEIIKKKRVPIPVIFEFDTYRDYLEWAYSNVIRLYLLKEDEFDLVKEVLCND